MYGFNEAARRYVSDVRSSDRATNEERSRAEVLEWHLNPPERYFAYVKRHICPDVCRCKLLNAEITTWTGERLSAEWRGGLGSSYRSNFGDTRYPIHILGTNGRRYSGTYYASSGDYCRLKAVKA